MRAITVHPGGINTNIARNARWHIESEGGRTRQEEIDLFAAMALTEPDKAAEVIHRGVEAGKARIMVGPDAYLFDVLTQGDAVALLRRGGTAQGRAQEVRADRGSGDCPMIWLAHLTSLAQGGSVS